MLYIQVCILACAFDVPSLFGFVTGQCHQLLSIYYSHLVGLINNSNVRHKLIPSCTFSLLNMLNFCTTSFHQRYGFCAGLPPSPPSAPESVGDGAFGNNRNARAMKPLGVDVGRPKKRVNGSLIAIAVLSTVIALIICTLAAWLLIIRFRGSDGLAQRFPHSALPKFSRSSGMCTHPAYFLIQQNSINVLFQSSLGPHNLCFFFLSFL